MNDAASQLLSIRRILIGVVLVALMYFAAEVLQPLALAILLAFILEPLIGWFTRRGLPRAVAIVTTLLVVFAAMGGVGYVVVNQFLSVADTSKLPSYEANIIAKLGLFKPSGDSVVEGVSEVAEHVKDELAGEPEDRPAPVQDVRIVQGADSLARLSSFLGPFQHLAGVGAVVLLLLVFLLLQGDELQDRIASLVGRTQVSTATKALGQISARLSKYLSTFAIVNAVFGLLVGLGVWAIGVPNSALWGTLAGLLRFVPYVGPTVAVALPFIFSLAVSPGWREPVLVLALFGVIEVVANSVEPVIYGKSTGVSSFALLVAALFWTWLWGPLGLLLSTPLTVCLAVIGRQIPSLQHLGILLGEDVEVDEHLRWFQRALSKDQDGAVALLDEAVANNRPLDRVFDQIIVPSLARADQDLASNSLDQRDLVYLHRVLEEWIEDLNTRDDLARLLGGLAPEDQQQPVIRTIDAGGGPVPTIVGVATDGAGDLLVLRLLEVLLRSSGATLRLVDGSESPLEVTDRIAALEPALILVSHVPPIGTTRARYLMKRIRARIADVPLVCGRWDEGTTKAEATEILQAGTAFRVVTSLAAARDLILDQFTAEPQAGPTEPAPGPTGRLRDRPEPVLAS